MAQGSPSSPADEPFDRQRSVQSTGCQITLSHDLAALRLAHTVIVAGIENIAAPVPPDVTSA
ncbi:MAG TPA: hypothetical protein VHS97_17530, partial [Isosphaeraceae bacterium]|nr:hypothetical protein [Isosphaeraceae bacterium]